ncbi:MAG: adenosylcobalamin-dependent ribonucleoside-diphosphate reductase [Bdellovibrionota bacterium]
MGRERLEKDSTQGRLRGILGDDDLGIPAAQLNAVAHRVLESRYLLRDQSGKISETPRQLFTRVAKAVASVERKWWRKKAAENRDEAIDQIARMFFELMASLRFLPNSPTLMNAGKPRGQLSACFVLPLEDDLKQVFETLRDSAVVHKTGGGTGFNFGKIRPSGDLISSSGGTASGPLAFLKIFDVATNTVKQGGARRGANMAIMPIDHPDIEEFIQSKMDGGIENFNISVGITDDFMAAAKTGQVWRLKHPKTGQVTSTIKARKLWRAIAEAAWKSGDPGVVFLDRINEVNPTPECGPMESTNPCGEQPLLAYESCNLGSMNLMAYYQKSGLDWESLETDIKLAVRFLDNVIEANAYPLLAIEDITLANRKIGLGVMGWADLLLEMGIAYDSDQALRFADETMGRIQAVAVKASEDLAVERGAFPNFPKSRWAKMGHKPRRNATVTTVAPTGTISLIAGVTSGIEPVFSLAFERVGLDQEYMIFIHPSLKRALKQYNVRSKRTLIRVVETGSVAHVKGLPAKVRKALKTASEIHPLWHVKMQAVFQKHTENGVSKTINLPSTATKQNVQAVYDAAYALGCKGITVFRDTSKPSQVLNTGIRARSGRAQDLVDAVNWLLDDVEEGKNIRKKASFGLASLSRAKLKLKR